MTTMADYVKKGYHSRVSIILSILILFAPFSISMYLPGLPDITDSFGITASISQLTFTATLFGVAIGQMYWGTLSDVYGRRKILLISIVFYIIASAICGLSTSIEMLILFRFLQGFAGGAGIVLSLSITRDLYSGSILTKRIAILMIVVGIAPVIAPLIAGQLLFITNWRGIFLFLSIFGVAVLILSANKISESIIDRKEKQNIFQIIKVFYVLLKDKNFLGVFLVQGFIGGAFFTYVSTSSYIFQEFYSLSAQQYSLVYSFNAIGMLMCTQFVNRKSGLIAEKKLLATGLSLSVFGGIIFILSSLLFANIYVTSLGLLFIASSMGLINPTTISIGIKGVINNAGSASALLGLSQFLFGAIVTSILGFMSGSMNMIQISVIILICQLISVSIFYVNVYKGKREAIPSRWSL